MLPCIDRWIDDGTYVFFLLVHIYPNGRWSVDERAKRFGPPAAIRVIIHMVPDLNRVRADSLHDKTRQFLMAACAAWAE